MDMGAILIPQDASHPREFRTVHPHAVFLVKVGIRSHGRNSCLIFQTQKDEALRCSRTLPSNYAHCHPRVFPSPTRGNERQFTAFVPGDGGES